MEDTERLRESEEPRTDGAEDRGFATEEKKRNKWK